MMKSQLPVIIKRLDTKSDMFVALLECLNQYDIQYTLVGKIRDFPQNIAGDVDIVVPTEKLHRLLECLSEIGSNLPVRIVQILQHEQSAFFMVIALLKGGKLTSTFLHPDICSDYYRNGRLLIPAKILLENCRFLEDKGFNAPAPSRNFLYYLIKRIGKGKIEAERQEYLGELYPHDPTDVERQISRYFKKDDTEMLLKAARTGEWAQVDTQLPKLQAIVEQACPFSIKTWLFECLRKLKRWGSPTGLWVVFLGPDGSGKSTVIEHVQKELAPAFRQTAFYNLRPGTMHRGFVTQPVTNPYGKKPRGFFASTLKLAAFWLDYLFGYLSRLRPSLVRSTLIIFDRHLVDMVIDPYRYRYSGSVWLARLACKLMPQPDLFILMDAPAETLQSRKQEVTLAESEKQRQAYLEWARQKSACKIVDSSQSLEQAIAEVNDIILSRLAERTSRRMATKNG
jgi:thymidylate kinase